MVWPYWFTCSRTKVKTSIISFIYTFLLLIQLMMADVCNCKEILPIIGPFLLLYFFVFLDSPLNLFRSLKSKIFLIFCWESKFFFTSISNITHNSGVIYKEIFIIHEAHYSTLKKIRHHNVCYIIFRFIFWHIFLVIKLFWMKNHM